MSKKSTQAHLDDIDFRSQEERQKDAPDIFVDWYLKLRLELEQEGFSDLLYGQFMMLGHVLWYTLPPKECKKLKLGKPVEL